MAWQNKTVPDLLNEMVGNVQDIVRGEVRLAMAEAKEETAKAIRAAAFLVIGAVLGLYAVGFLLLAAVYALSLALDPWLSSLIVGVAVVIIGGIFVSVGVGRVRKVHFKPEKTVRSIKEDVQWVKRQAR